MATTRYPIISLSLFFLCLCIRCTNDPKPIQVDFEVNGQPMTNKNVLSFEEGQVLSFKNTSNGDYKDVVWTVNGAIKTESSFEYDLSDPGIYDVRLCIKSTCTSNKKVRIIARKETSLNSLDEPKPEQTPTIKKESGGSKLITVPPNPKPIKDRDGDGFPDKIDSCPDEFSRTNNGCQPVSDRDGDGFSDNIDACPNEFSRTNNGCPKIIEEPKSDRDGDGFPDDTDACPDEFSRTNNGCKPEPVEEPVKDRDGDGIPDDIDACPDEYSKTNNGCKPKPVDSDQDGFPDDSDDCPNKYSKTNNGCPEVCSSTFKPNKKSELAGITVSDYSNCSNLQDATNSTIAIKVKKRIQLRAATIYANDGGRIRVTLSEKGGSLSENFRYSISHSPDPKGYTAKVLDLRQLEDITLCPDKEYELNIIGLENSRGMTGFANANACQPSSVGSDLSINYLDSYVLFDLKYDIE